MRARLTPWMIAVALAAAVAAVYAPTRHHGFVNLDDPKYVYENPIVRDGLTARGAAWAFTTFEVSNWHPLTWLSHMLDVELFGLDAGAHHLASAVIHALAAILLFLALRAATGATWRSALVAALFAVHPTHVESVAWVAERKDVLSGALFFATLLAWIHHLRRPRPGRYALDLGLFALALLSKPMAVSLPVVLLLLDLWPLRRLELGPPAETLRRAGRLLLEKAPFVLLAVASSAVTVLAQARGGAISSAEKLPLSERAANAALSYVAYLGKLAWPTDLAVFYPHRAWTTGGLDAWQVASATLLLVAVTALAAWQLRARPVIAMGWGFYLVTLLPVIGLVQVGSQAMADRYTYLPAVGIFTAVVWLGAEAARSVAARRAAAVLTCGALVALGVAARAQTRHWSDSFALYARALSVTSENWLAWQNLGNARYAAGEHAAGVAAFEEAVRLQPDDFVSWMNLGAGYRAAGAREAALRAFQNARRVEPGSRDAAFNAAIAAVDLGAWPVAIDAFRAAATIAPDEAGAWRGLALALAHGGDLAGARAAGARLVALDPAAGAAALRRVEEIAGGR